MGIVERKEKQKLEIRKLILDASMKLFVEEGFENVSMRKIADLIEYSPTTVYLYFKDKDEILFVLHNVGFEKMLEMNRSLADIKNPLIRLHKMGENYLAFGLENPEYYDLMFIQRAPMEKLKDMQCGDWESGHTAMQRLKETIQECMDQGFMEKSSVDVMSISIWSLVHGLVSLVNRGRMEKFCDDPGNQIKPLLNQSLNLLINTFDISGKNGKK